MVVNNFRASVPPPSSFPNPIQRPGVATMPNTQRLTRPPLGTPSGMGNVISPMSLVTPASSAGSAPTGGFGNTPQSTAGGSDIKALQAKQRQELLAAAKSFLNPQNKPNIRQGQKTEASVSVTSTMLPASGDNEPRSTPPLSAGTTPQPSEESAMTPETAQ